MGKSKVAERIEDFIRPVVENMELDLWDIEFLKEGDRWVLRVYIDHPDGISIEHCQAVSHAIDPVLDRHDPIEQSYVLQVSSAGLERVLKTRGHFERFIGSPVSVRLYVPHEGKKEWHGTLQRYDGQTVVVDENSFSVKQVAQVKTVYN